MLNEPLIEKLYAMKLNGMASALEEQRNDPNVAQLPFEDRLGLLVERQFCDTEQRAFQSRLHYAGLKDNGPCLEAIDYRAKRNLSRNLLEPLIATQWIRQGKNALITGPTGVGKTYLAQAITRNVCANAFRALFMYSPKLFRSLKSAELDGSLPKILNKIAKAKLLIIDDFGMEKANAADYRLILEILQDRIGETSTLVTSQYAVSVWHERINDQTIADAILDRIVHGAYRIDLQGESMRKTHDQTKLENS